MSMTEKAFEGFIRALAKANNLDLATAARYAALIGDTPLSDQSGKAEVRDEQGMLIATVILPEE